MGEPAVATPVRAVAGYGSAATAEDRAKIALVELERLGAFDRSVIVVAAPTGVGYVNYSFAEAVEYLTLGDCAIIVPQYALVPSFLALGQTRDGEAQQRLILAGIRDRIAGDLPPERRPRLMQFGESLGAPRWHWTSQPGTPSSSTIWALTAASTWARPSGPNSGSAGPAGARMPSTPWGCSAKSPRPPRSPTCQPACDTSRWCTATTRSICSSTP